MSPPVALLLMVGCGSDPQLTDLVRYRLSEAPELPTLQVMAPRFVRPFSITDPPAVYMFSPERPVDHPLRVSLVMQPASARRSEPHCGLVGVAVRQPHEQERSKRGPDVTVLRCKQGDLHGVLVDRSFAGERPFFCVATWSWKSGSPIPAEWQEVARAIESTCDRVTVLD